MRYLCQKKRYLANTREDDCERDEDDGDWITILTSDLLWSKIIFFMKNSLLIGYSFTPASSPKKKQHCYHGASVAKKGLTYGKCFILPMIDSKLNPIY